MIDLSICLPAIRPSYWVQLYDSFEKACAKYTFEVIFISPYDLPEPLTNKSNVKHLKSYATSVRAAMEGSLICEGRLMAVPADDGYAFPDSFDASIELLDKSSDKDAIVLRYREGKDMTGPVLPDGYWNVKAHPLLVGLGIPLDYNFFMQPLMHLDYFMELGGWDCQFEHLAFAAHDLSYRIQRDGGAIHLSPLEVMNCNWSGWGQTADDHTPIYDSHIHNDLPLFTSMYEKNAGAKRVKINFDNWKDCPEVWARRWPGGIPK